MGRDRCQGVSSYWVEALLLAFFADYIPFLSSLSGNISDYLYIYMPAIVIIVLRVLRFLYFHTAHHTLLVALIFPAYSPCPALPLPIPTFAYPSKFLYLHLLFLLLSYPSSFLSLLLHPPCMLFSLHICMSLVCPVCPSYLLCFILYS